MRYLDYIETNQGFQTSVNLELDLNKKEKIRGYIPTEQSVKVLKVFLSSFYYTSDTQSRACVLIGPYGRGKSHLFLVLTALTSMDIYLSAEYSIEEAKAMQYELCERIKLVDYEIGALAKAVVDSGIRTLPVVINSNSRDINQSFLVALNNSLQAAGVDFLLPKTYFDAALEVIDKWEKEIPEAVSKLVDCLKLQKTGIEQLKIGLKQFDDISYELFCDVYPKVAAGMKFNPMMSMDIVKLYLSVVETLVEQTSYSGINIIFDEFSKFLESNLEKSQMYNLKIIQDLAEAASRSGKKQIHFTCITHKDILEYSSSDSFKTVEGRFSKVYFIASSEQNYELISNAIVKKNRYKSFIEHNSKDFAKVINIASMANVFQELSENAFEQKVIYGCFPLAPLTVYSLLKVSELVGQNERTLFTFLASKESNALGRFLIKEHKKLEFVTTDMIYDYFEDLFKKEIFNASVHSFWAKADSAIKQLSDENQIKIIKAMSLISMIKDSMLKTIPTHIKAALLMDDNDFEKAVQELQRNHILTQRDSSEFVMLTANGVDVQKSINNYIKSKSVRITVCNELNRRWDWGYVIPHEHNDKNCILRCFKKIFMDSEVFCKYKNAEQILDEYSYDGMIIYIISSDKAGNQDAIGKVKSFKNFPQIVLCLSDKYIDIEEVLKKLVAVEQLKEQAIKSGDSHYIEEIEYFEEDLQKQVVSTVEKLYSPTSKNSFFVNTDGQININRQAVLNHKISDICDKVYIKTPVVNNEMVNKKNLNTQNLKGRDTVVAWLLNHSEDSVIPCMDGYGPEVSIFKSAFSFTGLDSNDFSNNAGINAVLKEIKEFITGCEYGKGNFKLLYDKLMSSPYGMRQGIIPLYIAYSLRPYKGNVVIYFSGKEVELSAALLSSLNNNPVKYDLLLEAGTKEREAYLDKLEEIFNDYMDNRNRSANRIYSIMRSMQNWYRSLPEYSKRYMFYMEEGERKEINSAIPSIRADLAKYDVNSRDIMFVQWKQKLSENADLQECAGKIEEVRKILDNHIILYRSELCKILVELFAPGYQGSLSKAVQIWYKKLSSSTKQHIFDSDANALLTIAQNIVSYDDNDLLDMLVNAFETIGIEDWNDNTSSDFRNSITIAIRKINEFKEIAQDEGTDCKLAITIPGIRVEKSFSAESISPFAKTALNNIEAVFDEYNDSLGPDEKLVILAQLISKVIQ